MGLGFSSYTFDHSKLVEVNVLHGTSTLQDKYEILKQIGTGTQGKTFLVKVRDKERENEKSGSFSGSPVYVVKETHDKNAAACAELKHEFERMKRLLHPNITKVVELLEGRVPEEGTWKECLYVVYEHAVGGDLFNYMQSMIRHDAASSVTEAWVAQVFRHVLLGVSYLHSERIVHNDLKPENLLCMKEFDPAHPDQVPWVTITDFGCAKVEADTDFCSGDPRYQSPETFKALVASLKGHTTLGLAGEISFPADIWSLGVTLFELLSGGVIPFVYEAARLEDVTHYPNQWEKLKKGVLEEELQLQPHLEGISESAADLLMRMLRKEPDGRPTAAEVLKDTWFETSPTYGRKISKQALSKLEFKKSKGMAHMILLNALATKLQRDHYAESWKVFQKVDADHNGSISLEEFRAACIQLDSQWCSCSQASRMGRRQTSVSVVADTLFEIADIDDDGSLNFPEFVAAGMLADATEPAVGSPASGGFSVCGGIFAGFVNGALRNLGSKVFESIYDTIAGSRNGSPLETACEYAMAPSSSFAAMTMCGENEEVNKLELNIATIPAYLVGAEDPLSHSTKLPLIEQTASMLKKPKTSNYNHYCNNSAEPALGKSGCDAAPALRMLSYMMKVTFDWSSLDKKALHQTLKRLFDQMDKNHDQKVSYEELAGIFQGALSTEEVRRAFSRIDLHGTNYLTFEELDTFLFSALSAEDM
ncbi:CPK24, partial [Symbiodinium microadriaticum]